jgi:hypothetical protein
MNIMHVLRKSTMVATDYEGVLRIRSIGNLQYLQPDWLESETNGVRTYRVQSDKAYRLTVRASQVQESLAEYLPKIGGV